MAKRHWKTPPTSTLQSRKNITYPIDGKLAIKVINRLNKLAKTMQS